MSAENPSRDNANVWIVVPFVLALAGTVVMLFTNSANVLKVSLVLALWAAAAGIIMTARLRRDRDSAERELASRDELHRAKLDAAAAREEADRAAASSVDVEVLREIQSQLAALRAQLEEMSGRPLAYEPAALRAEARRIAEIPAPEPAREPETTRAQEPAPKPEPAPEAAPAPAPSPAPSPGSAPTTRIQRVRDTPRDAPPAAPGPRRPAGAPSSDAVAGRVGSTRTSRAPENNPLSQLISERRAGEQSGTHRTPESAPQPEPAPAEEPRGGRRRRDERGRASLSVAELLARSKQEK
ncbi:hypothetical protein CAPI_08150 [Corynebacterium capitovis DSM 44611]|uniref:DUF6779 domain-containing protein n=1 Tax=Corynebacterium capitovis TaxID=131081 RepID=UPI00037F0081|nr:DUF6779 domain-containing protein [Corynebacterium capitovis]WKD58157.1 hypothetical protein CAPI_08150 [Corynebacterium capitovis DSM 44611]